VVEPPSKLITPPRDSSIVVKRAYTSDENRVVLSEFQMVEADVLHFDEGTTQFASFLARERLQNPGPQKRIADDDGDLFSEQPGEQPDFVVNGCRKILSNPATRRRSVRRSPTLRRAASIVVYRPHRMPAIHVVCRRSRAIARFVADPPAAAVPDALAWERAAFPSRAHWLVIDRHRSSPTRIDDSAMPT